MKEVSLCSSTCKAIRLLALNFPKLVVDSTFASYHFMKSRVN